MAAFYRVGSVGDLAMSSVCGATATRWPQEHGLANPKPLDYSTSGRAEQRLVQLARCALRRMSNTFWVGGSLLLVFRRESWPLQSQGRLSG